MKINDLSFIPSKNAVSSLIKELLLVTPISFWALFAKSMKCLVVLKFWSSL